MSSALLNAFFSLKSGGDHRRERRGEGKERVRGDAPLAGREAAVSPGLRGGGYLGVTRRAGFDAGLDEFHDLHGVAVGGEHARERAGDAGFPDTGVIGEDKESFHQKIKVLS